MALTSTIPTGSCGKHHYAPSQCGAGSARSGEAHFSLVLAHANPLPGFAYPPSGGGAILARARPGGAVAQLHAAMMAGVLDEPRARVFSEWTTELSPEQARVVCATLLPRAPELTTGQLIDQIKKLAITVDPDWARRRYEQALAGRKVVGSRNADGSAKLSGHNSRWIGSPQRADASTRSPKPLDAPVTRVRSIIFARSCSWG